MKVNIGKKSGMKPMKVKNPLRSSSFSKPSGMSSLGKKPSWMMTDREQQKQALEATKALGNRPPEFWLNAGETKLIRFRDAGPVACIMRYSVQTGPKQWTQVTVPGEGDTDHLADLGLRAGMRAVYEVIDIQGYTDKEGNQKKHLPRFFNLPAKVYEQLEVLRRSNGPLCNYTVQVTRTGSGQTTAYMFIPRPPKPMPPEWAKKPRLADDFEKYYAPPSEQEQRAIVNRLNRYSGGGDDDE